MVDRSVDARSIPDLLGDLVREITTLFRKEAELVRSELSDKVGAVQAGIGTAIAGAVLLLGGVMALLAAAGVGLARLGIPPALAALIVAVVAGAIGFVLLKRGMAAMAPSNLTPTRTVNQMRKDAHLAREELK